MSLSIKGWEQMPYFLATVRQGSLRAAAQSLGTTHAKVSRHLNALETSYGMQLLRRTRGGVQLTEAGKLLLPVAEEAENLFLNAQQRLTGLDRLETGTLRFSATGTMAYEVVSPILTKFAQAYPGIDIDVRVSDLVQNINRLETDVSLRIADEVTDDVVARKLYPLAMAYYASPDYLRKNLKHAGPKGQGLQLIGMGTLDRHPAWLAHSPFPLAEVRYTMADRYMQLHLARQGFGIIRTMPLLAKNGLELVPVAGNEPQLDRAIWILLHSDLRRTTRVRRFVDFLADELIALKPIIQGRA
ncbi:MAG: DNA-binding transcriptional LysR family regulator [Yoonia sp.]|jgi:DNA-binding transcriptional LysR family regulator